MTCQTFAFPQSAPAAAQTLVRINTFELAGKREALRWAQALLNAEAPEAQAKLFDMETDAPYLVAHVSAPAPRPFALLLEGHLDVVPPAGMTAPFDARLEAGVLFGRGSCDMKGGCAAILAAFIERARRLRDKGRPARSAEAALWLMLSTDEEYAGEEIRTALASGTVPKADFAFIAEPTSLGVMTAHKGEAWAAVDFFGKSAHSSRPALGRNAILMASAFLEALRPKIDALAAVDSPAGPPTMSVGRLEGGTEPNVVPDHARAVIDIRYLPGEGKEKYFALLEEAAAECRRKDPDFRAEISCAGDWPSLEAPAAHPACRALLRAAEAELGRAPDVGVMTGWGEGGFMQAFGVPAVYFGPGDPALAHQPSERCPAAEIEACARTLAAAAASLGL